MNTKSRTFFQLVLGSILFWILAFLLFNTIRYNGLSTELFTYSKEPIFIPVKAFYAYSVIFGFIVGLFYSFIEYAFDLYVNKRLVLGVNILLKSLVYILLLIIILSVLSFSIEKQVGIDLPNERGWWRRDPFFWNTVLYFSIASVVFSLVRIVNDKFGRGVFINMLLGKYKKPKEEERVLMFLDLKDSTTIAEQLGHVAYSEFIQDCFKELNDVLRKHDAEVYQYVGDEAVINWTPKRGFSKNNCVELFFTFETKLKHRQTYFLDKYNFVPQFKAGIHCGKLMVAEVGTVKKELAFHGDVINSASRIQGLCNDYNASILISETVLKKLNLENIVFNEITEDFALRGKEQKLKVFKVLSK